MSVTDSGPRAFDVTHARVLAIAGPMTLAHLTTPLLGIVGTAIIGQLGQAHLLGAVALSAVVFDCIFWLFAFLRMGTVALTAQALGAANAVEQRAVLGRALVMAGAIGAGLLLLQQPIAWLAYEAMGASAAVTEAAKIYFFVRVWSAPLTLGNYAVLGWLIGLARTDLALALQVAINLANVAATALLVLVLERGVAGAALGTVLAEAVGLAAGLLLAWRLGRGEPRLAAAIVLDPGKLVRMLAVNRDIMIRTAALIVAFTFFMAQGARAGDTVLAANAVLYNLVLIGAFFLDGFATAAEQLCGRAVGARDPAAFRRAVALSIGWGFGFAARGGGDLPGRRPAIDCVDDGEPGRPRDRRAVPDLRRHGAARRRPRLCVRRHLCRRHLDARHAQPDAGLACALLRGLVEPTAVRQCRPVGRDPRVPRRARNTAGAALPGPAAGNLRAGRTGYRRGSPRGRTRRASGGGSAGGGAGAIYRAFGRQKPPIPLTSSWQAAKLA